MDASRRTRPPWTRAPGVVGRGAWREEAWLVQGFIGVLFPVFPGYGGIMSSVAEVQQDRTMVRSPNVVATAREFFQCAEMPGAFFEDDGGQGTANAHWEERMFEVRHSPITACPPSVRRPPARRFGTPLAAHAARGSSCPLAGVRVCHAPASGCRFRTATHAPPVRAAAGRRQHAPWLCRA